VVTVENTGELRLPARAALVIERIAGGPHGGERFSFAWDLLG
jgi:hypothetical protein